LEIIMASRNPTLLVLALGLTLMACGTGGASTSARSSSSSPSLTSPNPGITAAPSVGATASPTAVPAPTYPANVMYVPAFSPLEVETYFVEPVETDIQVFYTIPAEGWLSWIGTFKPEQGTDAPYQSVGMSIVNVTNVVQDGCTTHAAADPPVGPTVDDMATALAALSPFILTKPPSDVTVDGFSGKYLELTVPDLAVQVTGDDTAFTDCTAGELNSWIGEPLGYAFYGYSHPGQVEEVWLLDVDGTRLMIEAIWAPGSPEGDLAELRSILDSIDIVP
jgi:hypothetical protein